MPIAQSEIQVTKGLSNKFCQVSGVKHYLKWGLDIYFIPLPAFQFFKCNLTWASSEESTNLQKKF